VALLFYFVDWAGFQPFLIIPYVYSLTKVNDLIVRN